MKLVEIKKLIEIIFLGIMKSIVVLYHNDEDGFGGAWAAWKKFKDKAAYFPMQFQNPLPKGIKDKEVYFIDFCPGDEDVMAKIFNENKKVAIIDHHESQIKIAHKYSSEFVYSDKNSGCVLAWDYFHPEKETPKLLQYIEDMDLWKFRKKHTREIIASLDTYNFDFKIWDKIARDLEKSQTAKKYLEEGKAIIKYQDMLIKKLVDRGVDVTLDGKKAISVNAPFLESEIGNYIYKNKGVIGLVWYSKNGKVKVSLRSQQNVDVSKIAQKFGGGGHRQASGFSFEPHWEFPWKLVSKKVKG